MALRLGGSTAVVAKLAIINESVDVAFLRLHGVFQSGTVGTLQQKQHIGLGRTPTAPVYGCGIVLMHL